MSNNPISRYLDAIAILEDRTVKATKNAESNCYVVFLHLHSDGSGRVVYRWSQRDKRREQLLNDPFVKAMSSLILSAHAEDSVNETADDFDSIEELEVYLKERNVL